MRRAEHRVRFAPECPQKVRAEFERELARPIGKRAKLRKPRGGSYEWTRRSQLPLGHPRRMRCPYVYSPVDDWLREALAAAGRIAA